MPWWEIFMAGIVFAAKLCAGCGVVEIGVLLSGPKDGETIWTEESDKGPVKWSSNLTRQSNYLEAKESFAVKEQVGFCLVRWGTIKTFQKDFKLHKAKTTT
jgi:hypothetical protein